MKKRVNNYPIDLSYHESTIYNQGRSLGRDHSNSKRKIEVTKKGLPEFILRNWKIFERGYNDGYATEE